LPKLIPQADLLVNTTPIGMHPLVADSPLSTEEGQKIKQGAIAYDLIYTPRPTQFLRQAQGRGAIAIDGLEMLVQQGAVALELWLNQPAPVEIMRQALLNHLSR
jgi:shikimate dehydrogenase